MHEGLVTRKHDVRVNEIRRYDAVVSISHDCTGHVEGLPCRQCFYITEDVVADNEEPEIEVIEQPEVEIIEQSEVEIIDLIVID